MKTDGPNHGGCNRDDGAEASQLSNCMWHEPSIVVDSRKVDLEENGSNNWKMNLKSVEIEKKKDNKVRKELK
jgi:hypothetical protein